MVVNNSENIDDYVRALTNWYWPMGGQAKLLLEIVINNRVWPVIMVVNNCKKIEDYLNAFKNWFWRMGAVEIIAWNCYQ